MSRIRRLMTSFRQPSWRKQKTMVERIEQSIRDHTSTGSRGPYRGTITAHNATLKITGVPGKFRESEGPEVAAAEGLQSLMARIRLQQQRDAWNNASDQHNAVRATFSTIYHTMGPDKVIYGGIDKTRGGGLVVFGTDNLLINRVSAENGLNPVRLNHLTREYRDYANLAERLGPDVSPQRSLPSLIDPDNNGVPTWREPGGLDGNPNTPF